jgi:hypothetical protein
VAAAKAGDATARAWLARYLVSKPGATAPAPLTVIVQQLSGCDPLVERLAKPHIDHVKYPSLGAYDDFDDAMRELIAVLSSANRWPGWHCGLASISRDTD